MGTRGAQGFYLNGKEKVTYNHFDSYPDELGRDMVEFIQATTDDELKEIAERIILIKSGVEATEEQIEECKQWADTSVATRDLSDWYCLLREAQGNPTAYKEGLKYMTDSKSFLQDSLFCEYAYIINIDEGVFEIYKGFNQTSDAPGRYAGCVQRDGYCGVTLVGIMTLDEIRKNTSEHLVKHMNEMCHDEEEE